MTALSKEWFARDTIIVARDLLGKTLQLGPCSGIIVETEAYADDPASHGVIRTERSELMYSTYGLVYVYLIYGMYHCLNFTTDATHVGAVLIRAVEPREGIPLMKKRRNTQALRHLTNGPGKLCQAFHITRKYNTHPIGVEIIVHDAPSVEHIVTAPRIGITKATELPWRFYIPGNPFVSVP